MSPIVSVIVPVYNAEATLTGTLQSALAQSFKDIEVLIVDDGSTDRSLALAHQHASRDSRVQVLQQANRGVAAARNLGISAARGSFIAPLDADDLWHPEKIARQVSCFAENDRRVGLVYNWYRRIDGQNIIIQPSACPRMEGWVIHRHLEWNFISNGSTPLIRKEALLDTRYNENLRASGNQGCEDYLLQLEISMRYKFACVPAFLTGYRRRGGEMSSDVARMIRSHIQIYQILEPQLAPAAKQIARARIAAFSIELTRNRLKRGKLAEASNALRMAFEHSPETAFNHGLRQLRLALRAGRSRTDRRTGSGLIGRSLEDVGPEEQDLAWQSHRSRKLLQRLADLDAQLALHEEADGAVR